KPQRSTAARCGHSRAGQQRRQQQHQQGAGQEAPGQDAHRRGAGGQRLHQQPGGAAFGDRRGLHGVVEQAGQPVPHGQGADQRAQQGGGNPQQQQSPLQGTGEGTRDGGAGAERTIDRVHRGASDGGQQGEEGLQQRGEITEPAARGGR